jgi:hypothetical protein
VLARHETGLPLRGRASYFDARVTGLGGPVGAVREILPLSAEWGIKHINDSAANTAAPAFLV